MRKYVLYSLLALVVAGGAALAAEHDESGKPEDKAATAVKEKADPAAEKSVVTNHSVSIGGRSYAYKATAGTLTIRDDKGRPDASVFYVAYTVGDGKGESKRPVTFLYNGGPGSASLWLHMGSFGPVRVVTNGPEAIPPAPFRVVENGESLLDKSDLVFVDAIGTGYSKGLPKEKDDKGEKGDAGKDGGKDDANPDKRFWGTDQDIDAFGRFIIRYVTVNQRWNSPKLLFGESYGTPRSAGLAHYLEDHGVALNGVVLLSSILNYGSRLPGLDNDYVNLLPTFAAIAWYHGKIPNKPATLEPFLDEVRAFARGEYSVALAKGQDLGPAERDAIAQKLSRYIGLSPEYLKEANLRVSQPRFRKELLRDQRRTLGRYDARFEGIDADAAGEAPETDPSSTAISGAFISALNDYLTRDLKYASDVTYKVSAGSAIGDWDWKHALPGSRYKAQLPVMVPDLSAAMRTNPHLKVLSANGWFDLATPFFATEYDLAHMDIDPKLRGNLSFTYYPSGHMVYLNADALKQFKADLAKFYDGAVAR
ncbi:MAG: peptidase S10 [Rudaea sp.]|uniref:S10 family peptidase n=1 Tax=Rudaea sp. TaxID=2136325 RepID=UPI0039E26C92